MKNYKFSSFSLFVLLKFFAATARDNQVPPFLLGRIV